MADPAPPNPGLAGAGAAAAAPAKPVGNPCATCGNAPPNFAGPGPAPTPVGPLIWIPKPLVLVKKPYIGKPVRQLVQLRTDKVFDGTGTFNVAAGADKIKFFNVAVRGAEIESGHVFAGAALTKGVSLFAEGVKPSGAENDITIQLALKPGSAPVKPPATSQLTSVEVTLDICKSRTSPTADPNPLSVDDKIKIGRFIHRQISIAHGRAMLIVRQTKPDKFTGILTLKPVVTGAATPPKIFPHGAEVPVAAPPADKAALSWPRVFAPALVPAAGLRFFIEGANTSAALRDIELQLGVKDVGDDGDHVKVTTVEFQAMTADAPTTPPNTHRMAPADNKVVPARVTFAASHTPALAADFDEDFTANTFLPLIENSIPTAKPVILSTTVKPAGVPVRWSARRDTRPAPKGDSPDISGALDPKPPVKPTVTQDKRKPLTATLLADSVGSFHVCAYVDCNGNKEQDFNDPTTGARIDREPFILLKLVLIRVKGNTNTSLGQQNAGFSASNPGVHPPPGATTVPNAIGGIAVASGDFLGAATAAVHHVASVDVVGGGRDGKTGLAELFAGWVNNLLAPLDIVSTYVDPTNPHHVHRESFIAMSNRPAGGVLSTPLAAGQMILPLPVLDTSPFHGNEGTGGNSCVGTEGVQGGKIAVDKHDAPTASNPLHVGQQWTVEMFDSPSNDASPLPKVALAFPVSLTRFTFNLNFRADLAFWTNLNRVPTPTVHAECHLYASVQTNHWTIRYAINFPAPPTNAPQQTVADLVVQVAKDAKPKRLASPVENPAEASKLEVRFPTILATVAIDARP